jgi:hypothetical protein
MLGVLLKILTFPIRLPFLLLRAVSRLVFFLILAGIVAVVILLWLNSR